MNDLLFFMAVAIEGVLIFLFFVWIRKRQERKIVRDRLKRWGGYYGDRGNHPEEG